MSDSWWSLEEDGFHLRRPVEIRPWQNFMANESYGMRISHLGDAYSVTLQDPRRVVTNYDFFSPLKGRFLYVRENGTLWNPTFVPTRTALREYECTHGTGWTRFRSRAAALEVTCTHFIPRSGRHEIWLVEVRNTGTEQVMASVYPLVEFLLYESFGIDPVYYSWFTDSRVIDDGRTIIVARRAAPDEAGFFASLAVPAAFEASLSTLRGNGDITAPEGFRGPRLTNSPSGGDPYVGCFQFDLSLAPGQLWTNALFIGHGRETLAQVRSRYPDFSAAGAELDLVRASWKKRLGRAPLSEVKSGALGAWLRTFFPYQIFQQAQGLVRSVYRGYRDVAQDAMGMSYFDPGVSRSLLLSLMDKQLSSGRCLRQWNVAGGPNDTRDFRDQAFWLALASARYVEATGDAALLSEVGTWQDSAERGTLLEHIERGLSYALQFGPHGLLRMGQGDWNDALSGLGADGESLWLSECAYLALEKLQALCRAAGKKPSIDIEGTRQRLYDGVAAGWTGEWFLRGYHESGRPIGAGERIYLLPQAWFAISGMAERDPLTAQRALTAMVEKLDNPAGLLKCFPAFEVFDESVGNLSALAPGMAENCAVYNHASAFGVYALLLMGRDRDGMRYFHRLLPFEKDPLATRSEPYVLVNFYNGGFYPEKAGQGGIPWLTSTVSWVAMILFDLILPRGIPFSVSFP
jgi:cellobiose phosphorylase